MNVERQTLAGLKWSTTAKVATQATSWVVTLIVIRLLVPADYGLMALSAAVISVFAGIGELGLGASLVQARSLTRGDLARVGGALLLFNGGCALVVCLTAVLFAGLFGHPRLELVLQVSSVSFLLSALASIPESIAYREMRFRWLAATDILTGLVTSGITLALALGGHGVWALVLGNLSGQAVRTGMLLWGGTAVLPNFSLRGIGALLRFGGTWSAGRLAWQLTYNADVVIAGRFLTQEAVGVYSVAAQLANLPLQKAMSVLNQVAFPAIARLQDELPRMRTRLLDAIRLLGFAAVPVLWGVGAVAPEFVDVVLGPKWRSVTLPLQMIALVAPLRMLSGILSTAMSALGRADLELRNTLVGFAVSVTAFFVGVQWGVSGLAVGYAAAVAFTFVANFPRTSRTVGISLMQIFGACRMSVVAGVAMLIAIALARLGTATLPEVLRLPGLVAVGALTYLGTIALLDRGIWSDVRRVASALREG